MKLEYIADGGHDTPLIRLYDFGRAEAIMLRGLVLDLHSGRRIRASLHDVGGIVPVGGCRLTFAVGSRDEGVIEQSGEFTCSLTRDGWSRMADLMKPFCEHVEPNRFQYLDESSGITLLLSVDGCW